MDFTALFDAIGEPRTIAAGALLIGILFGFAAQRSRFCLRSAVMDLTGVQADTIRWQRLAVWGAAFGAAIIATQAIIFSGLIEVGNVRQLTSARSLSGVLLGGALFGVGMTLTRGCVSRLTVLSANGNLRAVVCLAIFAAVAWATFAGPLAPLRQSVLGLWTLGPDASLNLLASNGFSAAAGIAVGGVILLAAVALAFSTRLSPFAGLAALIVGATIAAGWWFTYTLSSQVFEPIAVESISFTRPAIDVIALGASGFAVTELGFGAGLLAGVLLGSFAAALLAGELQLQWFDTASSALRYGAGAALMGFGGVLAGGCSVGAGVSGGVLFALAPLLALAAMIGGAAVTGLLMHRKAAGTGIGGATVAPAE